MHYTFIHCVFLVACLLCNVIVTLSQSAQSSTISYQVHSYNDLREWPQILRKGTVYFKVDPHYMPYSFCVTQPQVPQNEKGCFVLSHDAPVITRQYNSTFHIESSIRQLLYAQKIYIALCFKLDQASPCDGSAVAQNWTAITDSFFAAANAVVSGKGLNVEFILDGASAPTDSNLCLISKWRPWVSTWIPGDSEEAPYSNNATLGLDRFQVFNPPQVDEVPAYYIDLWKLQNYGKFSQGNYTYLIWEPSDQEPMLAIADSYLDGPIHPLGLRFAINIDPVQLQVFTGSRSGMAWNYKIGSTPQSYSVPAAMAVLFAVSDPTTFFIISTFLSTEGNVSFYTVNAAPFWSSTQLGPIVTMTTKPLPNNASISSMTALPDSHLFASQPNGTYSILAFNQTTFEVNSLVSGKLTPCGDCESVAVFSGDLEDFYVVQMINGKTNCTLQLQLWHVTNYTQASIVGGANCVTIAGTINGYSLAVSTSPAGESYCSTGYPGILTFSDQSNLLYTSVLCVDTKTGIIEINGGAGSGVVVDVGSDTSVSLYPFQNKLMVLEVHDNGFCWNSEPNNKQPTPATCSNTPMSVPYVLNYNLASFDDWGTHVFNILNNKNTSYNLDSIFNSCHPTILHGAYDSGSSPQAALFSAYDDDSRSSILLLAEIHQGLPMKYSNVSQCGFAVPMEGAIVLDSWRISEWLS